MSWAAFAPLIAQFAGQLMQGEGPSYQSQVDNANAQASRNADLQREFAQYGIRWRVEDAKAAGLHPMYALTGGGAAFSPNPIVMPGHTQSTPSGGGFGNAFEKALTSFFAAQQKKDDVISAAVMSNAALAQSQAMSSVAAPDGDHFGEIVIPPHNLQNAFDVQNFTAPAVLSRSSEDLSTTSGIGPGGSVHQLGPNFSMILPSSSSGGVAESLEALSESKELMYAYIHRNVEKFGEEWLDEAQKYFPVTSTLYRVITNVRNAGTWANGPALRELGHRSWEWLRDYRSRPGERGPTVSGRIRGR